VKKPSLDQRLSACAAKNASTRAIVNLTRDRRGVLALPHRRAAESARRGKHNDRDPSVSRSIHRDALAAPPSALSMEDEALHCMEQITPRRKLTGVRVQYCAGRTSWLFV